MDLQPTLVIGLIGAVSDGKSTLVRRLSGTSTARFHKEIEGNRTIKLGYANAKIYKCTQCMRNYESVGSLAEPPTCSRCDSDMTLVKHVSFLDCPGHDQYMSIMVGGVCVMDAAIFVIGANAPCPMPQTKEHLAAITIAKIKNVIVCQNKIDLLKSMDEVKCHKQQIDSFLSETTISKAPVLPISAAHAINLDVLLHTIVTQFTEKKPESIPTSVRMMCVRSFDINKPGTFIPEMNGGVLGGTLFCGSLKKGDPLEIRPGKIYKENGKVYVKPLMTTVVSMKSETVDLPQAVPGGLIGIQTTLNPEYTKANALVGHMAGTPGTLPPVYRTLNLSLHTIEDRCKGAKIGETLLVTEGSFSTRAKLTALKPDEKKYIQLWNLMLEVPICTQLNQRIAVSRKVNDGFRLCGFRLCGYGKVMGGEVCL